MKKWLWGFLGFAFVGCILAAWQLGNQVGRGGDENRETPPLDDYGPAPELENEVWLNTAGPLRLENLRGKVVAIDMWTFG